MNDEVQARQVLNAETGLVLAAGVGCEWLGHLDSDELFYTGDPNDGTQVGFRKFTSQIEISRTLFCFGDG